MIRELEALRIKVEADEEEAKRLRLLASVPKEETSRYLDKIRDQVEATRARLSQEQEAAMRKAAADHEAR